ncbi:hypothetical protein SD70_27960 [Gordoniibacillus kamchatkensis]|uniref:Uncharacterized protein n=1 Tax=Gordoniibacillus kamchatkensis TaxID=1590651 RepID=A0ABR5AAZ2_9BACL|nr:hypothetical protein [Paenibacillus sp. VKM B-2647]KIL38206.1 hypothetical protein SD70_27960 [Paenibacillus sp. VKM B-2647]
MEKRLNRTDYLFAMMFILMLVCVLGAFFFGVRTGQQQAETKYEKLLAPKQAAKEPGAYEQQVLVSFYHSIYSPYREFEQKWFQTMGGIELGGAAVDAAAQLKELGKVASAQYGKLQDKPVPATSPLLVEAQQNYLKALKLFGDALSDLTPKANSLKGNELAAAVGSNAYYIDARNYALTAQKNYYDSIVKWNQSIDAGYKPVDTGAKLSLADWGQLSLNSKNDYLAAMMLGQKWFKPFKPQDLTVRVDEFIASGEAKKLNVTGVQQAVELLVGTDAVRSGDFIRSKQKFYSGETLPQIPFFYEQT